MNEIQTIQLEPLETEAPPDPPARWYALAELRSWVSERRWFFALVIVPTALAAVYLLFIAASRFEVEARFVVRSPSTSATSQLTNLVQGTGIIRSADDAYIVHAYMKSRDVVRELAVQHGLLERLQREEADFLWSYPQFWRSASDEALWRHFQHFISIDFDSTTGISTLKVQGFRPDDARDIAQWMLDSSERMINALSTRAHQETLRTASAEVEVSRAKAQVLLERVSEFRKRHEIIDPGRVSTAALEMISRLAIEIAMTSADLKEIKQIAAESPQARSLERRIAAYEEQITRERQTLAGTDTSLAPLIAQYERLTLEREFAERAFASSQAAFDNARIDAERQRLFIERISTPSTPDYPKYPMRFLWVVVILGATWITYAIGRRLVFDTQAHAGN